MNAWDWRLTPIDPSEDWRFDIPKGRDPVAFGITGEIGVCSRCRLQAIKVAAKKNEWEDLPDWWQAEEAYDYLRNGFGTALIAATGLRERVYLEDTARWQLETNRLYRDWTARKSIREWKGEIQGCIKEGRWETLKFYRDEDGMNGYVSEIENVVPFSKPLGLTRVSLDRTSTRSVNSSFPMRRSSSSKTDAGSSLLKFTR